MATTTLKTRIQHKYDTPENWAKASTFVPLKGEICVFNNGTGVKPEMKIGDGTTALASLPFLKAGGDIAVSRSLTSGTKIATITVDGVATDLYCQTNTDTTYSAGTGITLSGTTFSIASSVLTTSNYTSYVPTKTGSGASGTWGINITGSSASCTGNAATATALSSEISVSMLPIRLRENTSGTSANPNTFMSSGFYYTDDSGIPNVGDANILTIAHTKNKWCHQLGFKFNGGGVTGSSYDGADVYTRIYNSTNSAWSDWYALLSSGNYTAYTVTKTGGGASGTWGINISGNAAAADKAARLCTGGSTTNSAMTFNWSGQSGQPTWLWGGTDGINMYVYNPSNFSVNYANSSASSNWLNPNGTCQYGASGLNYFNESLGTTASATSNYGPTADWYHIIRMNHANSQGYYVDLAACFHSDNLYFKRVAAGTNYGYKHIWVEGNSITGAVWNDYAECRESHCTEPGRVVQEVGDDTLIITTERLSHFAGVVSDTWGFCQGETERAKTPIAVAGRVLAYTYRNRNEYQPGDCVCAAPDGTIDIMTREEVEHYPDRIVGTVSCVPDYEEWGQGDRPAVKVDGRIWIKVR